MLHAGTEHRAGEAARGVGHVFEVILSFRVGENREDAGLFAEFVFEARSSNVAGAFKLLRLVFTRQNVLLAVEIHVGAEHAQAARDLPLEARERAHAFNAFFLGDPAAEAFAVGIDRAVGAPAGNGAPAFLVLKGGEKLPFGGCLKRGAEGVGLGVIRSAGELLRCCSAAFRERA